jgi:hypothetical protein
VEALLHEIHRVLGTALVGAAEEIAARGIAQETDLASAVVVGMTAR